MENKKCSKPPTNYGLWWQFHYKWWFSIVIFTYQHGLRNLNVGFKTSLGSVPNPPKRLGWNLHTFHTWLKLESWSSTPIAELFLLYPVLYPTYNWGYKPNIHKYPICEPWCWKIYQHLPEQNHPNVAGWWLTYPSEKYESQWEGWHPIYEMENKIHVWNILKPPRHVGLHIPGPCFAYG